MTAEFFLEKSIKGAILILPRETWGTCWPLSCAQSLLYVEGLAVQFFGHLLLPACALVVFLRRSVHRSRLDPILAVYLVSPEGLGYDGKQAIRIEKE